MSFRLPQTLGSASARETALGALDAEIAAERAANLGRLGRAAEAALADLGSAPPADREVRLKSAADAVWTLFVQREMCGLTDHGPVVAEYAIPSAVLARLGAT